jgi:hypothetical protein
MNPSSRRVPLLVLLAGVTLAGTAAADEFEQHGVHEHGHVEVNVALDGATLAVELVAPAVNVVGFERAPRTDAERKAVADVAAKLGAGRGLVGVPPSAGCRLLASRVDAPQWSGGDHADYRASLTFRCANPAALKWVELWMLRDLRDVAHAEVNVVTSAVQRQLEAQPGNLRVPLE